MIRFASILTISLSVPEIRILMISKSRLLLRTYGRGLSLFLMMALGVLVPQAHELSFLIQYLLMAMLFFAFLDIRVEVKSFSKYVIWVLLANVIIAFIGYGILLPFNITFALVAFVIGIAPAAIASPVVISFIKGKVEFSVAALLLTNIFSAMLIPIVLPFLVGENVQISIWDILLPTLIVMFVPLLLTRLVGFLPSSVQIVIKKGKQLSFVLWMTSLFIVSAKASNFIRSESTRSVSILMYIALISLGMCAFNYTLGALIGGREFRREARQALGQKNLAFVIWIALTFINPLVAVGPTLYILYHNVYNSWLIYQFEKQRNLGVEIPS